MNCTLFIGNILPLCIPLPQHNSIKKNAIELFSATTCLVVCLIMLPNILSAQLRELEITPDATPATIPVFTDYPENAAVIINSSIPNLQFSSTLDIIRDLSQSGSGRYVIIIPAARQSIQVSANGFITQSFSVGNISAREVRYFRVEPKNVNITETGTLIIRTNPSGAAITIDGIPGTYTSPHTFSELLAQGYTVRVKLADYEEEAIQVSVNPDRPHIQNVDLIQTFGFLTVNTPDATLFLRDDNNQSEYRRSYTVGQPLRLDVGSYQYRVTRDFHLESSGTFEIGPNQRSSIAPILQPAYGTLQVNANAPNITLTAADNNAPNNPTANEIYLEHGRRTVVVNAPGFVQQELDIRIQSGERIDRSVTLETISQRDERVQREGLPRGVLEISADVDAEILVNGVMHGRQSVVLTLVPGQYTVELRHPIRKQSFSVEVPSADMVEYFVELRPVRSRALSYSTILPGLGHMYRKEWRGYIYLGMFAGAAVYGYTSFLGYTDNLNAYNDAQNAYRNSTIVEATTELRSIVQKKHRQVIDSRDALIIAAGVVGGVYALQLLDVTITRPRYGYRGSGSTRAMAYDGGSNSRIASNDRSVGLSARMDGAGITLRASF